MKQKIALVLGSGGARGTAHIGVIRYLLEHDYEITSISGTSMGALVGGIYACGKLAAYEEWVCNLDRKRALSLVDFTLSSNGVIKADRFISEIKKFIPDTNIENLNIPLTIIATDMKNKKEKVIEKGSLWEAIRASISIPMIITPAKMDDELFVDGGVLNPVPTNRVFRQEGDKLIAVNVNAQIPFNSEEFHLPTEEIGIMSKVRHIFPTSKAGPGYFQMVSNTSAMMVSQIANLTLQLYPPDILISISGQSCSTFDFHKANGMVSIGKIVTSECLENYHKNK